MIDAIRRYFNDGTLTTVGAVRRRTYPAYLCIAIGAVAGVWSYGNVSNQRVEDLKAFTEQTSFNQCMTRVDTRDSLRGIFLGITALFDPASSEVQLINAKIESDYPKLDSTVECDPLLEGEG